MEQSIINIILLVLEKAINEGKEFMSIIILMSAIWLFFVYKMNKKINRYSEIIDKQNAIFEEIDKILTRMEISQEYKQDVQTLLDENKKLSEEKEHLKYILNQKISEGLTKNK